jgi:hypothetical protein
LEGEYCIFKNIELFEIKISKSMVPPPPSLAKGKFEPLMVHIVSPHWMRRIF